MKIKDLELIANFDLDKYSYDKDIPDDAIDTIYEAFCKAINGLSGSDMYSPALPDKQKIEKFIKLMESL